MLQNLLGQIKRLLSHPSLISVVSSLLPPLPSPPLLNQCCLRFHEVPNTPYETTASTWCTAGFCHENPKDQYQRKLMSLQILQHSVC